MDKIPRVKKGGVKVPLEDARRIAGYLRNLNEFLYCAGLKGSEEYRAIEFDAYCLEQAKEAE